jgi:hypothetical protein
VARVERVVRVLKDDLNPAALVAGAIPRPRSEALVVEENRACRRRMEPGYAASDRRLAAARLADERDAFAGGEREGDVVRRDHLPVAAAVNGAQALDREEARCGRDRPEGRQLAGAKSGRAPPLEAADPPTGSDIGERRELGLAAVDPERAARRECTAGRALTHSDRDPGHSLEAAGMEVVGDRGDEAARIRVLRFSEDLGRGPLLHDPAGVHDGDPVGDLRDHREIVRDVHHREPALATQAVDLLEHPGLRDDVEACRRLVEDDERRLADESGRDHHALLLPA